MESNFSKQDAQHGSWFASAMALGTRAVLRFPRLTLGVAIVLAIVALTLAGARLGLRTSRLDLLNPESDFNQRWIDYLDEFGHTDDAIVVVEGGQPKEVESAIDSLAAELEADPELFEMVLAKVDLTPLRSKGLHYLSDQQLEGLIARTAQLAPAEARDWSTLQATRRLDQLRRQLADPRLRAHAEEELIAYTQSLHDFLRGEKKESALWSGLRRTTDQFENFNTRYLTTDDGRIGWLLVRPVIDEGSFEGGAESIERMREVIQRVGKENGNVTIGLTGLPVLEYDEMLASQRGSTRAAALSLLAVAVLFVVGFGSLRHPLLTVLTLVIALAWTMGYITLAVGHLNILSMAFGVILIGLGIDFGVHYVARYLDLRPTSESPSHALIETARSVGPGVVAGGVTTALAFFTAGLTDFTGVVELGIIAGGGILICVLATIMVLPPLIQITDRHRDAAVIFKPLGVGRGINWFLKAPRLVLLLAFLITGVVALGGFSVRYDHNLLNLQSPSLESVVWERRLLDETPHSAWFAVSVCDSREQLLERKKQFEGFSDTVQSTEEIVSLLPESASATGFRDSGNPYSGKRDGELESKLRQIASIRERLQGLPEVLPSVPVDAPADLDAALASVSAVLDRSGSRARSDTTHTAQAAVMRVRGQLQNLPPAVVYSRLSAFQQVSGQALLDNLTKIREASRGAPPNELDLPAALVGRFISPGGKHLLKVYSRADIWDMDTLEQFVMDVRKVDPEATGQPLQTYEASRQMARSYGHAALYSLIAVCMVLMLDFSSLRHVFLALTPLAIGMALLFGLLGWFGIPLNPANMIVLPLILGIGIDDGVHVIHDYRRQLGRTGVEGYRLGGSTATAIVMTSLTTMVGFGSLMVAEHRGLQSLGRVLTIGVACCMVSSLIVLPAFLRLLVRRTKAESLTHSDAENLATEPSCRPLTGQQNPAAVGPISVGNETAAPVSVGSE